MSDVIKILYHFWQARKLAQHFTTKEQLYQHQQDRLQYFIENTLRQSPFYCQYRHQSFQDIPILDKSTYLKSFDQINTVGITLHEALRIARHAEQCRDFSPTWNGITIGLSSGTSGKQNIFMASKEERLKWAGIMLAKALPGSIVQSYKIAFFLRANSNLYTTLCHSKQIYFEFFDLMQPFAGSLQQLNHLQPNILTAPASVLTLIARAQHDKIINIKPDKIFSVAEVLEPDDQRYIEVVFKQKLHQIYQCTEGFLGITNEHGMLYLNEEYVYIEKEWIDKNSGRFVPIITDFTRTTQPIVRYRLDDVLVEDTEDKSPYTCLRHIEGRCDDICYFESETHDVSPVFADALRQIMTISTVYFEEYTIIQQAMDVFEVAVEPEMTADQQKIFYNELLSFCKRHTLKMPQLRFRKYRSQGLYQKRRRIERRFISESNNTIGIIS